MIQRAIFKERKDGKTFDCDEISRVLSMDIPVALILEMPRTMSGLGSSHILLYFQRKSNVIIYDTMRKMNKFLIKKIANIKDYSISDYKDEYDDIPLEQVKEYKYAINLAPFLKPTEKGIYRYIIDFEYGSKYIDIVVHYEDEYEDRHKEKLEIWYYNDIIGRCKKPEKLGTWVHTLIKTKDGKKDPILVWETKDGVEIEKGTGVPHICGYHEPEWDKI